MPLLVKQMTKVIVNPGICGFNATIEAVYSGGVVRLQIDSECKDIKKLAETLPEVSSQDLRSSKSFTENKIYKNAARCIRHFSCPIPCAIMKAIEVELGLALKKNVTITFINEL
jgi:hypothetical protein